MMKKSLWILGVAVAVITSCTNTEVTEVAEYRTIGFDAFVGNTTKAVSPIDLAALKAENGGFYVYGGYATVDDVFNNTRVYWKESSWVYTPLSYWKEGETYKFAAYAPALNVTPEYDYATNTLTFTGVKSDMNNQKDFIAAQLINPIVAQASNNAPVAFTFRHALSMIKIKLINGFRDGVQVQIVNDFKLSGINTQGNFVTTTGAAGTWSEVGIPADFTDGGATLDANGDVYEPEFIVIPQTVAADAVTVSFSVILTDAKNNPVLVPGGTGAGNVKAFTIKIPAGEWNMQNRYSYSATIDGELLGLQTITFADPTVEEWEDYNDTPVTIQ